MKLARHLAAGTRDPDVHCTRESNLKASSAVLLCVLQPLDPVQVLSGDAPVLAVRLTQLAGGGSILAVTAAHVVLGECVTCLMSSSCWTVLQAVHQVLYAIGACHSSVSNWVSPL